MNHLVIKVYGKVQDVFFRDTTKKMAEVIGVFGYVKNMPDGSVLAEVEGDDDQLDLFIAWCKKGPREARVEKIEVENAEHKHYKDFQIL